jgi:hypothetical protein
LHGSFLDLSVEDQRLDQQGNAGYGKSSE